MHKTRINLANPQELLGIPGIDSAKGEAILRHRAEKGPIEDGEQLAEIIGPESVTHSLLDRVDFAPAYPTAPEAPGA